MMEEDWSPERNKATIQLVMPGPIDLSEAGSHRCLRQKLSQKETLEIYSGSQNYVPLSTTANDYGDGKPMKRRWKAYNEEMESMTRSCLEKYN
jgi:hypothetical protein